MEKSRLLPAVALVITGIALFGTAQIFAQDSSEQSQTIVQRLAQKFGLKETDVQSVFDEERAERHMQMQSRIEEKLTQSVNDGEITETQKQAIMTKMKEMQTQRERERESMENMTYVERKELMEKHRSELEAWAKEEGIDMQLFFFGQGKSMGMNGWHMKVR